MSDWVIVEHLPVEWPFDGSPEVTLYRYRKIPVDPCPAYPHDSALVARELDRLTAQIVPPHPLTVYVLDHEGTDRLNGVAFHDFDYSAARPEGQPKPLTFHIALNAKRVPPHPAMTRYVIAHEYGHCVESWLMEARGFRVEGDGPRIVSEYAELRGLPNDSGRRCIAGIWHLTPSEVFADDFRVVVAQAEVEYWPHPGVPRLSELEPCHRRAIDRWWKRHLGTLQERAAA